MKTLIAFFLKAAAGTHKQCARAVLYAGHGTRCALYAVLSLALGAEECVVCGAPVFTRPLCRACRQEHILPFSKREQRCKKCGKELISETELCMKCRNAVELSEISFCFAVYPYMLWMKELLFVWKSRGIRLFSPMFAQILSRVLAEEFSRQNKTVVPVPPRPGKIRKKGWDQIDELCAWLKLAHNVPVMRLLRRTTIVEQKKLDKATRKENAKTAYCFDERAQKKIARGKLELPQTVILLDDVRTTGTTLETCAALLKARGVQDVQALVLFYVG
jgi:ComF family protein